MDFSQIDTFKKIIDEYRPFEGHLLKELRDYYRIGLTWSSNAIEGNTLTESETKILLEDGLTVGGKPLKDTFEALGHAKAYDFMFSLLHANEIKESDILTMHSMFYSEINKDKAGRYRDEPVMITGSRYAVCKHERISDEMAKFINWANSERDNYHPIEYAAQLHKRFVFIHPFIDGNGRIARLLMNTALIQRGYLLAIIPPVIRHEYIQSLEKAHRDDTDFVKLVGERVLESEYEIARLLHIDLSHTNSDDQDECDCEI